MRLDEGCHKRLLALAGLCRVSEAVVSLHRRPMNNDEWLLTVFDLIFLVTPHEPEGHVSNIQGVIITCLSLDLAMSGVSKEKISALPTITSAA